MGDNPGVTIRVENKVGNIQLHIGPDILTPPLRHWQAIRYGQSTGCWQLMHETIAFLTMNNLYLQFSRTESHLPPLRPLPWWRNLLDSESHHWLSAETRCFAPQADISIELIHSHIGQTGQAHRRTADCHSLALALPTLHLNASSAGEYGTQGTSGMMLLFNDA